jgi:hypothetical protein
MRDERQIGCRVLASFCQYIGRLVMRSRLMIVTTLFVAGGLMGLSGTFAVGEEQSGLNIGDNDGVYVDGKTFQVIPGKAKGDAAVQIKGLAARELGAGAIIFRKGDRLYIADAQGQGGVPALNSDPRSINPALTGGGSSGYNAQVLTYAYDPRCVILKDSPYDPRCVVAKDYVYDPRALSPALTGGGSLGYNQQTVTYAYDPDYAEYRLKKAMQDYWPSAAALGSNR